jgi:hypothetical protein
MGNSVFPQIKVGRRHYSGARLVQALIANQAHQFAWDGGQFWFEQYVPYTAFTAAATSQTLDLHAYQPRNLFPSNCVITKAVLQRVQTFAASGLSALTGEVGHAGDTDAFVTSTSVLTTAGDDTDYILTASGAEYGKVKSALIPTLRLVATGANLNTLTAGKLIVRIGFTPLSNVAQIV